MKQKVVNFIASFMLITLSGLTNLQADPLFTNISGYFVCRSEFILAQGHGLNVPDPHWHASNGNYVQPAYMQAFDSNSNIVAVPISGPAPPIFDPKPFFEGYGLEPALSFGPLPMGNSSGPGSNPGPSSGPIEGNASDSGFDPQNLANFSDSVSTRAPQDNNRESYIRNTNDDVMAFLVALFPPVETPKPQTQPPPKPSTPNINLDTEETLAEKKRLELLIAADTNTVNELEAKLENAQNNRMTAQLDKKNAEAAMEEKTKNYDWADQINIWRDVYPWVTKIQNDIDDADKRIAYWGNYEFAYDAALDPKREKLDEYQTSLDLLVIKTNQQKLDEEEEERNENLVGLYQESALHSAQRRIRKQQFESVLTEVDSQIATATENEEDEKVEALQDQRGKITSTYNLGYASWLNTLASDRKDVKREENQNSTDGLGATNLKDLMRWVDTQPVEWKAEQIFNASVFQDDTEFEMLVKRAQALQMAENISSFDLIFYVPPEALTDVGRMAKNQAEGAVSNTEWNSIFNPNSSFSDGAFEFLTDFGESNLQYIDVTDLDAMKAAWWRPVAYTKGVALAIKDGVVDLVVLAGEGLDLTAEGFQYLINMGLVEVGWDKIDVVGSENIEWTSSTINSLSNIDSDQLSGAKDKIIIMLDRKFEQLSGQGEQGVYKMLEGTGYVVTTLVGGEDAVFKVVPILVKGAKGYALVKVADSTDELVAAGKLSQEAADTLADTSKLDVGAPSSSSVASKADESAPNLSDTLPPPSRAPPVADTRTVTGFDNLILGPNPQGGNPIPYGTVKLSDGTSVQLNKTTFIGAGSTSAAYRMPNGKILKFTRNLEGQDLALDRHGYDLLVDAGLDSDKLHFPTWHSTSKIPENSQFDDFSGGVVALIDEAPASDFKNAANNRRFFTLEELKAYRTGMEELASKGIVFFDNKIDNFYFIDMPDGSKVLGIPDTGSLVKVIDPNTGLPNPEKAHEIQQMVDAGNYGLDFEVGDHVGRGIGQWAQINRRLKMKDVLNDNYGPFFDLSGTNYGDITDFPFLPSGLIWSGGFPGVKTLVDVSTKQLDEAFEIMQLASFGKSDIRELTKDEFAQYLKANGVHDNVIDQLANVAPADRKNVLAQMTDAETAPQAGPVQNFASAGDATVPPPGSGTASGVGVSMATRTDSLLDPDISKMADAEFVDFLRQNGWTDSMIEEMVDLPAEKRVAGMQLAGIAVDGLKMGTKGTRLSGENNEESGVQLPNRFVNYLPAQAQEVYIAAVMEELKQSDPEYWTEERLDEELLETLLTDDINYWTGDKLKEYFQDQEPRDWGDDYGNSEQFADDESNSGQSNKAADSATSSNEVEQISLEIFDDIINEQVDPLTTQMHAAIEESDAINAGVPLLMDSTGFAEYEIERTLKATTAGNALLVMMNGFN